MKLVASKNPLANHRLELAKMRPTGAYCLARMDPPRTKTDGGILIPDNINALEASFVGAKVGRDAPQFTYDKTAVVVALGPDAVDIEIGERFLITIPIIPITVANGDEEYPLGLFDSRDINCKVV